MLFRPRRELIGDCDIFRMTAKFKKIVTIEDLDEMIASSANLPVLVVKHSNTCGISLDIFHSLKILADREVNYVVVQENRDLSNELESRTGIRHQSPQAIIFMDGKAIYHSSHYAIDPANLEKELSK